MSGDIIQMARNGTTLLPGESRKMAMAYDALLEKYHEASQKLGAAVRDATIVREIRARKNVVVEVSPELLHADAWSDEPLHVLLTKTTDGTHTLTFRASNELRTLRAKRDAAVRDLAHYKREAEAELSARLSWRDEANRLRANLDALTSHMNQVHEELGGTDTVLTIEAAQRVMARLAACEQRSPITAGDTQENA
jgi:hypothetical protein